VGAAAQAACYPHSHPSPTTPSDGHEAAQCASSSTHFIIIVIIIFIIIPHPGKWF